MSLRVIKHHLQNAGMPATPRGTRAPQLAVACHDTEGMYTEQGAWNTISWMHATAAERNASYNEFWVFNEETKELLVIEVVAATHAAHSIAPQPYSSGGVLYDPDAEVRAALGANVWDPNMWVYAVSIAGRVADVERFTTYFEFREAARARLIQIGAEYRVKVGNLLEHFRFNPRTRTDWGRSLVPALLEEEGMRLTGWRPVREEWTTGAGDFQSASRTATTVGGQFWTDGPGLGLRKSTDQPHTFVSVAESADGLWRLGTLDGAPNELLVFHRFNLRNPRNRNPLIGYGISDLGGGISEVEVANRITEAVSAMVADLKTKASAFVAEVFK